MGKARHRITGCVYDLVDVKPLEFPNGFGEYQEWIWVKLRREDGEICWWLADQVEVL
jgi:hypothetical protein